MPMIRNEQILIFLSELRNSSDRVMQIFTEGSCTRLYFILKAFVPEAELYWSDTESHGIIKIKDNYYDIGGLVEQEYVKIKEYNYIPKENHEAYHLLKHSEVENIKNSIVVGKYFKKIIITNK